MQKKPKFPLAKFLAGPAPDTANTAVLLAQLQRSTDRLNRRYKPGTLGTPQRPAWQWAAIDALLFIGRVFKHQMIVTLGYNAGFLLGCVYIWAAIMFFYLLSL
jgi:hypothetical protein